MQFIDIKKFINSLISSIVFIIVIIFVPLYFYITNDGVKYEVDLGEKRTMRSEIEVKEGDKFFTAVEEYYNDHIPFRSIIISINRSINDMLDNIYTTYLEGPIRMIRKAKNKNTYTIDEDLKEGEQYMDLAVDKYYGRWLSEDEVDPYDDTIEFPQKALSKSVIVGQSGWMFLADLNLQYYRGDNIFTTEDEYEDYIRNIGKLNDICKEKGKTLVILISPEKDEIYKEYMPTLEIKDEEELPIKIGKYIEENTDINYVYPKDAIIEKKDKYRLYKKYDSHWNKIGAYIALTEIYKTLGMDYTPIEFLRVKKVPETIKDLTYLGNVNPDNYNDSFEYEVEYKEDVVVTPVVRNLPKPTADLAEIYDSTSTNHKSVFLYGDSYRLDMVDFIKKDFEHSTIMQRESDFTRDLTARLKEADIIIIEEVTRNSGIPFQEMVTKLQKALIKK